jgi:hypothetical protein
MASQDGDFDLARTLYLRGAAYLDEGLLDEAEQAYRACLERRPNSAAAWFDLGLTYKWRNQWQQALVCNRRAAQLDPADEAAWWNLGTAATALRDWATARAAWRAFGLALPDGNGPIDGHFGKTCVRLNPREQPEVVWCRRIDPVRAIVESVPKPGSRHRWGDVVLHDGERIGERRVEGMVYPVFNELERWEPSEVPTIRVEIDVPFPADVEALGTLIVEAGHGAEDWTESFEVLCKTCSEGVVEQQIPFAASAQTDWVSRREMGIAAPLREAERLLRWWAGRMPMRRVIAIEVAA